MTKSAAVSAWLRTLLIGIFVVSFVEMSQSAKPSNLQWLYTNGKKRSGENDITSGDEDIELSKVHGFLLPQPPFDATDARFVTLPDETVGLLIKRLPPFWRQFVLQMIKLSLVNQRYLPDDTSKE
ncbi:uncharacterized protein [Ptychodera flava]|uniref:uncharacterized protein n=1 Tax=Ptychodera flava TaxID=63121 RepID=UPI00396A4C03